MFLRIRQLAETAARVLRREGAGAVLRRGWAWLRGERGYFHRLAPDMPDYAVFTASVAASPEMLRRQRQDGESWTDPPRIDVITVLTDAADFARTADALAVQSYPYWRWLVVGGQPHPPSPSPTRDTPSAASTRHATALQRKEGGEGEKNGDTHVVSVHSAESTHAGRLNDALRHAQGEYVALVECGDTLAPDTLYEVARRLRENPSLDAVYTDMDVTVAGETAPLFKPDWSPEMMLSFDLLAHGGVVRREMMQPFDTALEGAHVWDSNLRLVERGAAVGHVPRVLYHAHEPRAVAQEAVARMLAGHLRRRGISPHPPALSPPQRKERGEGEQKRDTTDSKMSPFGVRPPPRWTPQRVKRVSIIIPTRDRAEMLERCLSSVLRLTDFPDYEIVLVDTGSTDAATLALYGRLDPRVKLLRNDAPFNFSRACNLGAGAARGDALLFLNNDTEALNGDWLHRMAQWLDVPGVGVVGTKLLFPDGALQHAGMIVGIDGLADNLMPHLPEHSWTMFGSDDWLRNLSAVTGACLMISREAFERAGGWDEAYALTFSDVKLCLDAIAVGYRVVYTPDARLLHHEGRTRRNRQVSDDLERARALVRARLPGGDPFYNPNLSDRTGVAILDVRFQLSDKYEEVNAEKQRVFYLLLITH